MVSAPTEHYHFSSRWNVITSHTTTTHHTTVVEPAVTLTPLPIPIPAPVSLGQTVSIPSCLEEPRSSNGESLTTIPNLPAFTPMANPTFVWSVHDSVCPIGICETARRIIATAILSVAKGDIQESPTVCRAVCWHRSCGLCHEESFIKPNTAVLLVDASNAFNSLNRQAALHNIRHLCPPIVTTLINTYCDPTSLFIDGFSSLVSRGYNAR